MNINLRKTIRHALTKNETCDPYYNAMGLRTWEYVSEKADDDILTEKYYQTFEKMVKEEGVYLDLIPHEGITIEKDGNDIYIHQKIEMDEKTINKEPIRMNPAEFEEFEAYYEHPIEGHYGIAITEEDDELNITYGSIGPANPSGHCPPAFFELDDTEIKLKFDELIKNAIIYDD